MIFLLVDVLEVPRVTQSVSELADSGVFAAYTFPYCDSERIIPRNYPSCRTDFTAITDALPAIKLARKPKPCRKTLSRKGENIYRHSSNLRLPSSRK